MLYEHIYVNISIHPVCVVDYSSQNKHVFMCTSNSKAQTVGPLNEIMYQKMICSDCTALMANSVTARNLSCAWTIKAVYVLQKPGLTVLWQSALISCSSWLSNFSRDGWREMVSLFRVKGSILSS